MTNPKVYLPGLPKTFDNVDKEATKELKNRPVPTEQDLAEMLENADAIENKYFRLRIKAILGRARRFEAFPFPSSDLR